MQQARVIGHDLYIASGSSLEVIRNIDGSPSQPQKIFSAPQWYESVMDVTGDGQILLADTFGEVFASRDGGVTWAPLFTAPDSDPFISSMQILHGDIYVAGTAHIWADPGEGTNWSTMPGPVDGDFFTVGSWGGTATPLVVSAAFTGIFTTNDNGASYRRVGIAGAAVNALAVTQNSASQPSLLAGTDFADFATPLPETGTVTAATRDWGITGNESAVGEQVTSVSADPANPHIVYQALDNAFSSFEIDRSTDGGATWTSVEGARLNARAYQVVDDPANPQDVYAAVDDSLSPGLLVSRDGGNSWRKNQLPAQMVAIAADPANPDHIWLGGPGGLYVSRDQGQTVTRLSTTPVTALAVDPADPQHLIVGGDGLWVSRDGGQTLSQARAGDFRLRISSLLFAPGGQIYAGAGAGKDAAGLPVGGRGVLTSKDGGHTWANISGGLPDLDVASLAVSPDDHWLYAGTEGGGVYRLPTGR